MKLKRAKAYKKQMSYLQLNFRFHEPYQVLVDEEIVLNAVASKYDLVAGLERTLQGSVKVLISQCAMEHLYRAQTPEAREAVRLAKTFERRRCGHLPERAAHRQPSDQASSQPSSQPSRPSSQASSQAEDKPVGKTSAGKPLISAFECIAECVGPTNKHRYCIATQKPKLRAQFRRIPGVPLVYINRSVMIMEPMSPATERARTAIEQSKLTQGLNDAGMAEPQAAGPKSKHKGPKGPNPLSVKKRQRSEDETGDGSSKKRRKRGKRGGHSERSDNQAESDS